MLVFLVSFVGLLIAVIKPQELNQLMKKDFTKKSLVIFFSIALFISFVGIGIVAEPKSEVVSENTTNLDQEVTLGEEINDEVVVLDEIQNSVNQDLENNEISTSNSSPDIIVEKKTVETEVKELIDPEPKDVLTTVYDEIRERAVSEWLNDTSMQNYEYNRQKTAYEYILRISSYPEILDRAISEWPTDYVMQRYEYDKQKDAHEIIEGISIYPDIKSRSQNEWPTDYVMQLYEYNRQKNAYESLVNIPDSPEKSAAISEWPNNYVMQLYEYNN